MTLTTFIVGKKYKTEWGVNFSLNATSNRRDALKDATFVVISIEVSPRFGLWDEDWKYPQQFGFKQIYAENGGPGGLFHSLRINKDIFEKKIRKLLEHNNITTQKMLDA